MRIEFKNFSASHLLFKPSVRHDFNSRTYQESEKLAAAKNIVKVHLISTLKDDLNGFTLYKKLLNLGYQADEIIEAIAIGWLDGHEYIILRDINEPFYSGRVFRNLMLPLLITIAALILVMLVAYENHSEIFMDIMAFPPMVGVVGFVLFLIIYRLTKKE